MMSSPTGERRTGAARTAFLAITLGLSGLVVISAGSQIVGAGPVESALAQSIEIDKLDFRFERPRTVTVYPGDDAETTDGIPKSGRVYWYMPYTLVNKGDSSADFFVSMRAESDTRRKYADLALPFVERKIEQIERRPLHSKSDAMVAGEKFGAHQTYVPNQPKECVAIFNPLDPETNRLTIDVHGLVNDIAVEELGDGRFRITERVLRLTFARPGDEYHQSLDRFEFLEKKWETKVRETDLSK